MALYRRMTDVQAIPFHGNFDEIEQFVGGDAEFRDGKLLVATIDGPLRASRGDWIIMIAKDKFVAMDTETFVSNYLKTGD